MILSIGIEEYSTNTSQTPRTAFERKSHSKIIIFKPEKKKLVFKPCILAYQRVFYIFNLTDFNTNLGISFPNPYQDWQIMEILALKTSAVKAVGASPTPPSHKYTWRKSSEDSVAYLRQGALISLRSMETSVPIPSQPAKVVMSASRQTGNLRFPVFNFFFKFL